MKFEREEKRFVWLGFGFGGEDGYESEFIDVSSESNYFRKWYCLYDEIEDEKSEFVFMLEVKDINKRYIFDFF